MSDLERISDANVDAAMMLAAWADRLASIEAVRRNLLDQNEALGRRARELEDDAMHAAECTVEAVLMLEEREERLRETGELAKRLTAENRALHARVYIDGKTGLYTHGYFQEALQRELERANRRHTPLSVLFLDADHFKHLNDHCGHAVGDRALMRMGQLLRDELRQSDLVVRVADSACVARYGGEEFEVLLPGTDLVGAGRVAERLRARVEATEFEGGDQQPAGRLTVSIGIAQWVAGEDPEALIRRADVALYEAKRAGRNRVAVARAPRREAEDGARE